ncbi:prepilin-type N-terminal cleavage/methylation domain-containing protein [Candidatus Electrothrix marina]|uniref:Type II secretion system protein H n=1 Tax=Candidatus Electrothrix marina TaxID=1859130 RepID=A0A3S3R561_9BACT|nr:prepilin-type N-terminal cleavage/methylation domain-containing protein [Candidatus Electrothrix marina]RWX50912.1 prepilin-type N-terminal cleavage/methylation domain-containing protein [Candidatus Electrothrix marina]RWX52260.1 prepilin-type N-terminal cleavage/methylation domain-containing protein [Candidatus Electrothrix marina]
MVKMNKRRKYSGGAAGFSAPELLIVMAIIGILAGIGIPSFLRSQPERRLANATRNLYSDLQKARLLAVRNNTNVVVSFDLDAGTYTYANMGFDESTGERVSYPTIGTLSDYGAVRYGCDATKTDWSDPPVSIEGMKTTFLENKLRFTSRGIAEAVEVEDSVKDAFVMLSKEEGALLQNDNDKSVCFAVTLTSFGAAKIRKFSDGGWK